MELMPKPALGSGVNLGLELKVSKIIEALEAGLANWVSLFKHIFAFSGFEPNPNYV